MSIHRHHRHAMRVIFLAACLDVILGVMFAAAQGISAWDGLYFATTTATTVGYGDITPHGWLAHVIAVLIMITVLPLFAATFSLFTSGLASRETEVQVQAAEHRIRRHTPGPQALYTPDSSVRTTLRIREKMKVTDPVRVTTIQLRGVGYPVTVDEHGVFRATVEDHELHSSNLRELITQAERVPRRKVAVRFAVVSPGSPRSRLSAPRPGRITFGTATGFHATSTDSLLVDYEGQRRGQMSGRRIENAVRFASEEEADEARALLEAKDQADQALYDWIDGHAFDVHAAVREALGGVNLDGGE